MSEPSAPSAVWQVGQKMSEAGHAAFLTGPGLRDLLTGRKTFEGFDCVYAAGLYDYLQQKTARRLTRILFDSLRSRGRLLIANFLPDISDVGFMESYMGWKLIYRSRTEFLDVTEDIPLEDMEDISLYTEPNQTILFLEIEKR